MNKKALIFAVPLLAFLILTVFLYRGLSVDSKLLPSALESNPLPEFSAPSLTDDTTITSESLIGKPFFLNVWATWCPSCRHEHNALLALSNQGIRIIGLNYKDDKQDALTWLEQLKDPYEKVIADENGDIAIDLGVYGAPETFLINSQGIIQQRFVGVVTMERWENEMKAAWQAAHVEVM